MLTNNKIKYLSGLTLISLASLAKWVVTSSLNVDLNPIPAPWTWWILGTYYCGLLLSSWSYYNIVLNKMAEPLTPEETLHLAYWGLGIMFFMAPMLAADMAGYLSYGSIAQNGIFAYVNGEELLKSDFINYVSPHWKTCPNHYGPFLLLFFYLSVFIGKSYILSLIVLKLIYLGFGYLYIRFAKRLTQDYTGGYNVMALTILCPIIFIEGMGQLHVDFIIATLLVAVIYYLLKNKWWIAAILVGLVGASKFLYLAVFIPFLVAFIFVDQKRRFWPTFVKSFPLILGAMSVTMLFCSPVWEGIETITTTINYHASKNPTNSVVNVFALILCGVSILISEFAHLIHGVVDIKAIALRFEDVKVGYFILSKNVFKYLGVLLAVWQLLGLFYLKETKAVFHLFAKVLIIVICFYSPQFYPWYLLIILPFLAFTKGDSWMKYVAFIFPFSLFYEAFYPSLNGVSSLVGLYLVFVFIMCFMFFKNFMQHFILETYSLIISKK